MSYIKQEQRCLLGRGIHSYTPEALAYQLTRCVVWYLERNDYNYNIMNSIIGALESVKSEFCRRVVIPYENKRMVKNGDIYPGGLGGFEEEALLDGESSHKQK